MTQAGQFCTVQMGNFLQMPAENWWRVQLKSPARNKSANGAETDKQITNGGIETDSRLNV